ncbi:TraG family conjugative transposon ATPase [Adhaeribacter rhizoryzae]|uniref:TraG family conjugative transposon ATPase n=1 Tax=Adhaeribacter rhizoryzae TaxID=2607907 RepID=A0A5M6CXK5_9BACT|nr:TraG family conjugative transposon ATPase [Adhaeribacter rhizoryzae]KAA5539140.1 TraG family conjugative transposon ATPase [Adhaeribacter rhizoryzae]
MKAKEFSRPFIGIKTYAYAVLFHEKSDHSVIIKITNPVLQYSADVAAYQDFHHVFSNIIKILGAGYTVQKLDILALKKFRGKASADYLSQKYNEAFTGREYRDITTYLTITRNVKRTTFFTYDEKDFKNFERNVAKVVDVLQNRNFQPVPLKEKEIISLLNRFVAFNFSDEVYSFNNFSASEESIKIGNRTVKSISLVDIDEINFPATIKPHTDLNLGYSLPVDLMHFLHAIPGTNCIAYNQTIQIPDQRLELAKLAAKRKKHTSMPDPANDLAVADIDRVMTDIARDNQLLVFGHYNIILSAPDQVIDRATNYLESSLFSFGIIPSKQATNQLELFRAAIPGNQEELKHYDKFQTTTDAAICLLFKESLLQDEASEFQILFSDRQGIPVAIDTSDLPIHTQRMNNRNKFVLGPSGTGKSFFMNHMIRQYALQDTDIILVDTGHSYSGLCQYYGGRYITYSEEKPITMNPFRIVREEFNEEKREFLKSLIGLLWKGAAGAVNQIEDSVISSVISAYYEDFYAQQREARYLSFQSFYDFSISKIAEITEKETIEFDLKSYRFILKKFCLAGEYGAILNNEMDSSLFDDRFIVFEIDAIKEHKILFPLTTIIIMDVFLQKMRHKKNRKALIIEEAWKAIASPLMAGYILYVYKTVRKFWGEAVVVTQELDDIIGNAVVKNSIINNSDTICLLDQTKFKDNFSEIANLLALNEVEQNKIFTINNLDNHEGRGRFKEVYIKRGARGEVYGVEVSLHEYLTFTTERKEKEAVALYLQQYPSYQEALDRFVQDFRQSGLKLNDFTNLINRQYHEKVFLPA